MAVKKWTIGALGVCIATFAMPSFGRQDPDKDTRSRTTQEDNTKVNKRDRRQGEPTADQAKNNTSDRDMMQKVRQSIRDDKDLSSYAHNVKVIARNGKLTLKGPVRSEEEKQAIEHKATEVAGAGNVVNEMTVKAPRTGKADRSKDNSADRTSDKEK